MHTLLGTGWALTFYWVQAIGLAGVREADEWPGRNPRDPANRWVEAFGQEEWDDEDWGFTAQLVTALLEIWGFPRDPEPHITLQRAIGRFFPTRALRLQVYGERPLVPSGPS